MNDAPSRSALERLFNPRSIALVGATERSIWSIAAHDNLRRFGYEGRLHMVNPKGGIVFGQAAATRCSEIGEPVDAALLMVPEARMAEVIDDLRQADVAAAVILSAGFAEVGAEGAERQRRIAEAGRAAGIRLLGPNCLGFANFAARAPIWTTPLRRPTEPGSVAVVSQSGALASQLEQFAYQQRIGITHLISTGNEADLQVADAIEYLAGQPEPRAIALFLESVRDPARFLRAVAAARAQGKPVVVLKVGSSEAAARAAQAHTGSLVGDDRMFDALCRQQGMTRVQSLEELVVTADLFARLKPVRSGGLAVVALSGGMCEIVNDLAEAGAIAVPTLAAPTLARLRETLPEMATPANPLDITGAAMLQPELIAQSVAAIAADPAIGLVSFVFDAPLKQDAHGMGRKFIEAVGQGFASTDKPCVMVSNTFVPVNGEARALTEGCGVPYSGGGVRLGLAALGHLLRASRWAPPAQQAMPAMPAPGAAAEADAALPKSEREVLDHLARHGVPVVPGRVLSNAAEAAAFARTLPQPVVLKIASPDIAHKTEVGGVALNLRGDDAVRQAFDRLLTNVQAARPEARLDGMIVAPMRGAGTELFVGTLRDPQWGPAIVAGLGGVWVEALKDSSLRLLPITEGDALQMLDELRGRALLDGFRGAPVVDRAQAARAIVAIGQAALALGPELVALEVNPLLAHAGGIEALDGLVEWKHAE